MNLVKKHHINYSTIRHILLQYQVSGKTDIRKYKLLEYNAAAGLNASEINFDILNSEASNESITSLEVLDGSAEIYQSKGHNFTEFVKGSEPGNVRATPVNHDIIADQMNLTTNMIENAFKSP